MNQRNIINDIVPILRKFDSFTLEELEAANMLERRDLKFIFPEAKSKLVVERMLDHYKILEVKGYRYTNYETVYYDTSSFKYYLLHHNENLNRLKVRTRRYVQSDLTFYELKFKNNKGWVSKERQLTDSLFLDLNDVFTGQDQENLQPKIKIDYIRITFLSKDNAEKLTLDFNLKLNHYCPTHHYDNLVIAEMKRKDLTRNIFTKIIKDLKIDSTGISKYCMGVAQAYPDIKQNNFKQKLLTIKKIEQE